MVAQHLYRQRPLSKLTQAVRIGITYETVPAQRVLPRRRHAAAARRPARIMRDVRAIQTEMQAAGVWVFGGGLHPANTATVLRQQGGDIVTTDGPFIESKEQIGGITHHRRRRISTPRSAGGASWRAPSAFRSRCARSWRTTESRNRAGVSPRVRSRGGRAGAFAGRHLAGRGGGPGCVRDGAGTLARERRAARPGRLDHHHGAQSRHRPLAARGHARRSVTPRPCNSRNPMRSRSTTCATTSCA